MMNTIEEDYHLLLPDEITTEILCRLPAESVMQCKLVCKTWRALIVDPNFIYVYTHHYSLNNTTAAAAAAELEWASFPDESSHLQFVKYYNNEDSGCDDHDKNPIKQTKPFICYPKWVLGIKTNISCNGLIFMTTLANRMFICNPFTREYVDLPRISFRNLNLTSQMRMATGFGYHSSTNEYKVIIIYYSSDRSNCIGQLTIYTLGNGGGWRDKGEISHMVRGRGVLFNGAIHLLTQKLGEIVSFDLADEEFRIVPSPPPSQFPLYNLGLLGGCLYVSRSIAKPFAKHSTEIWVMDSMEYSWSKKFNIPWMTRPLALLESGKILLHRPFERLNSYDPETGSSVFVGKSVFPSVFTYTKTIVSLKALGETDATIFDSDATILVPDDLDLMKKKRKRNSDNP